MLGQDDPSTNLLVLEGMQSHREENELPALATVGSCGLYTLSGAFETGFKKTNWKINGILKAIHRLVQDSPARRYERDWIDKISKTIQNLKLYLRFTFYSKKDSQYSQL